jgi:ubiquinone/menaquinone biosynthesis C-methylase UbiE
MKAKIKHVKVNSLYSFWAREYDKQNNLLMFLEEKVTRKLFNFTGKKILDLGCGTGRYATRLAKNNNVTGVDFNNEMLEIAREKAMKAKVEVKFEKSDVTKYKPKNSADIILSMLVHDHVKNLDRAARVIFLASKQGTRLFVTNVNPKFTYESQYFGKRRMFGDYSTDEYYHPLGEYLRVFRKYGFELVNSWDLIFEEKYFGLIEIDYPELEGEFLGVMYEFRRRA